MVDRQRRRLGERPRIQAEEARSSWPSRTARSQAAQHGRVDARQLVEIGAAPQQEDAAVPEECAACTKRSAVCAVGLLDEAVDASTPSALRSGRRAWM
jgi:hypothetical protein